MQKNVLIMHWRFCTKYKIILVSVVGQHLVDISVCVFVHSISALYRICGSLKYRCLVPLQGESNLVSFWCAYKRTHCRKWHRDTECLTSWKPRPKNDISVAPLKKKVFIMPSCLSVWWLCTFVWISFIFPKTQHQHNLPLAHLDLPLVKQCDCRARSLK